MTSKFIQEHNVFFENISRKVMNHLSYAELIDESLTKGSLKPLVVEAIEKKELENLEKLAQEASKDIEKTIQIATDMGFSNTAEYLEGLKGELPGTFALVKLAFGGDPKKAAEEIGKVTSVTSKLNLARDSFNDAVLLFGTELEKLPFAQEKSWEEFKAANADEDGKLTVDGLWNAVGIEELIRTVKEDPLGDVIQMAEEESDALASLEFPGEDLLRQAAENSYKPPPEPKGMWGKLMSFFGKGDLEASDFADDVMATSLSKLIDKAKEIKAAQAEAEKDKEETAAVMQDIGDDLQDLGQGDTSAVSGGGGGGKADQAATQTTTVNMPGAGDVPLTPQTITQVAPGFDQAPEKAADKKMVPIPELEKTVTRPEDVEEGEWLASLVNDDPKSAVVFFDPDAAAKAAKEAEKEGGTEKPLPDNPEPDPHIKTGGANDGKDDTAHGMDAKGKKTESWVHRRKMSDWLFESSATKRKRTTNWVHKTSLKNALFTEAIFYKDVAKALLAQGVEEADLPAKAAELAKRLENQYDVQIADLPKMEVEEETVAAAEQIQQSGLTAQDLKDILAQQGEANKQNMEMLRDILAAKDESEVQRALARAKEKGVNITNVVNATAEASAEAGTSGEEAPEEEKPAKKRDRTGPPSDKMKGRGKEVGLEPKKGETGEQFGRRVRKEEEKQGKRTKQKKGKKPKEKPKKKSGGAAKASASASASVSSEAHWHRGTLLNATLIHKAGSLTEVLLGPSKRDNLEITDHEETRRWSQLAGLEDE